MNASSTSILPSAADVIIIGGGIIGISTALFLARQGLAPVLLEKGRLAGESSGRAFGLVSELLLDPVKAELSALSKRLWREIQAQIGEVGYRRDGVTFFADSPKAMAAFEDWRAKSPHGKTVELFGPSALSRRYPVRAGRWQGAIHMASDGGADPDIATCRLAGAARREGARIFAPLAVRRIDTAAGRIAGVSTEHGRITAPVVICAANLWTRRLCLPLGVQIPQLQVIKSIGRTQPLPQGPAAAGGAPNGAWRRNLDGSYTVATNDRWVAPITPDSFRLFGLFLPTIRENARRIRLGFGRDARRSWRPRSERDFEQERVFEPQIDASLANRALSNLRLGFHGFDDASLIHRWAGAVAMTPDDLPILSSAETVPGLFVANGGGYGHTWALAIGAILADLVQGRPAPIDVTPFRLSRFTDGSPLRAAN